MENRTAAVSRPENLALAFQEVLTAIVRLRSRHQAVSNAEVFRAQMREALKRAEQEAGNRNYPAEDVRLATFAAVAFLDESVLNLRDPAFADWPRKPMQEEIFGGHVAGELFFQSLQRLLGRPDSEELADVLEVFDLCMLLGYKGKYGGAGQAELRSLQETTALKIRRIRKGSPALSPAWAPPGEARRSVGPDRWVRRLLLAAGAMFLVFLVLLISFKLSLGSGVSDLQAIAVESLK